LLQLAEDSAHLDQLATITRIHNQVRDMQVMVTGMQEGMIAFVGQSGVTIEEIKGKDNKQAGREAMLEHGEGSAFIMEAKKFAAMLNELVKDPAVRAQITDHLEFTSPVWDYAYNGVANSPLVVNYYMNTDAAKGIALAEYTAIAYLLHP